MPGEIKLSSIVDIPAISQEIDATKKKLAEVDATIKSIKPLSFSLMNANGLSELKKVQADIVNLTKSVTDAYKTMIDIKQKDTKATIDNDKAKQQQLKTDQETVKLMQQEEKQEQEQIKTKKLKRQEQEAVTKLSLQEAKQAAELSNDYLQLSKAYNDAALKAKNYALTLGEQHPVTVQTVKDAKGMYDILYRVDSAVGQHQRNVGNYASAFNGLNQSFAQVARELPSLTISAQQFFLAISNNLPMVADEIARAKVEIAALKAEGKDAPSLLSRIGGALFSWQTLLAVGITLLTAYGKELVEWVAGMFKGADATKAAAENLKLYASEADNAKKSLSEFNTELQQLQQLYSTSNKVRFFGNSAETQLLDVKNNLAFVITAYNELGKKVEEATERTLKAGDAFSTIVAKYGQGSEEAKKAEEDYNKIVQSQFDLQEEQKRKINEVDLARRQLQLAQKQFDEDELQRLREINQELHNTSFQDRKESLENEIDKQKEITANDSILYTFRNDAAQKSFDLTTKLINLELAHKKHAIDEQIELIKHELEINQIPETQAAKLIEVELAKRKLASKEAGRAIKKNEDELNKDLKKIYADRYKFQQNPSISTPHQENERLLKELEDLHTKGLISEKDYQLKLAKLRADEFNNLPYKEQVEKQLEAHKKFESDYIKTIEEGNQYILDQTAVTYKKEQKALDDKFNNQLISQEEFQKESVALATKYTADTFAISIKNLNTLINETKTSAEERMKYEKQLADLQLQLDEKVTNERIQNLNDLKNTEKQFVDEFINLTQAIIDGGYDKQKKAIQDLMVTQDAAYQQEITNIQNSTLSQQEKADKITVLQAEQVAKDKQFQNEQMEIDRKKARLDKIIGIATIGIHTAETVSTLITKAAEAKAEAAVLASNPFTAAYASVALASAASIIAQIPLVIAMGAAQIAAIAAVPAMEKGGKVKEDGPVLVSEKGRELYISPSGEMFYTPAKPSILYLEKGGEVIPNHELGNISSSQTIKKIIHSKYGKSDNNYQPIIKELKEGFNKSADRIVNGYKRNRPYVKVNNNIGKDIELMNWVRRNML
ncbi:MAG TPA: hypothetical protein VFW07_01355 [Parafilimonas sp.]|nr:hypothetical protein [Parafilimonas sp.]